MFHKPWRLKTWAISLLRGHWLKMRSVRFIFWLVWIRALMELSNYAGLIWYHCWPCWLRASGNSLCFVFSVCIVSPSVFSHWFLEQINHIYIDKKELIKWHHVRYENTHDHQQPLKPRGLIPTEWNLRISNINIINNKGTQTIQLFTVNINYLNILFRSVIMRYIPVIKISRRICFLIAKYLKILNSQLQYCIQPNLCVRTIL